MRAPFITRRVRYVRAADPVGRMLITAAFNLWGEELPDWRENEYARGQIELLMDTIRVATDGELADGETWEAEEIKDRLWYLINSVQGAMLDEALRDLGLAR